MDKQQNDIEQGRLRRLLVGKQISGVDVVKWSYRGPPILQKIVVTFMDGSMVSMEGCHDYGYDVTSLEVEQNK